MEIFNKRGSKERLFEMLANVNKLELNEEFSLTPNQPTTDIVEMVMEQINGDIIKITNDSTMEEGGITYVELLGKDDNNNIVKLRLAAEIKEGTEDGVYPINQVELTEFNYRKADGSETIVLDENGLNDANQNHQSSLIELMSKFVSINDSESAEVNDELYEDAVKWIDSVPFRNGTQRMQTSKAYGDEKPTNPDVRVDSPELDQFVSEDELPMKGNFMTERSADSVDVDSLSGEDLLKAKISQLTADLEFSKLAQSYENYLKIKRIEFQPSNVIQRALSAARDLIAEYLQQVKGFDVTSEDVQNYFQTMTDGGKPVVAENQGMMMYQEVILKAFYALLNESGREPSIEEVRNRANMMMHERNLAATRVNEVMPTSEYVPKLKVKAKEMLVKSLGREPTEQEIIAKVGDIHRINQAGSFGLNEEDKKKKSEYPDQIGKTFKPKSNYPKKKKKPQTTVKIGESIDQDRYEDVVFMQGEEADEPLEILKNQGEDAAMEYLMQWHDPGNHMGSADLGHGSSDRTYEKDGYIMAWNFPLNYIGLVYDLSQMNETEEEDVEIGTEPEAPDVVNLDAEIPDGGADTAMMGPDRPSPEDMEASFADYSAEMNDAGGEDLEQVMQDKEEAGDMIPGGLADEDVPSDFDKKQLAKGLEVEMEHTDDPMIALEIAMDHLVEDPEYYGTGDEDPEAMAQQGAEADAAEEDDVADELLGFKPHNIGDEPDVPEDPEEKEETDELLGYKPHNIGDYEGGEEEDDDVDEVQIVGDEDSEEGNGSRINRGDQFSVKDSSEDMFTFQKD